MRWNGNTSKYRASYESWTSLEFAILLYRYGVMRYEFRGLSTAANTFEFSRLVSMLYKRRWVGRVDTNVDYHESNR